MWPERFSLIINALLCRNGCDVSCRRADSTLMHQRSEEYLWRFLVPIGVLWRDAATLFATRLSLNSTHPSVKSHRLDPDFLFFLLTWRSEVGQVKNRIFLIKSSPFTLFRTAAEDHGYCSIRSRKVCVYITCFIYWYAPNHRTFPNFLFFFCWW